MTPTLPVTGVTSSREWRYSQILQETKQYKQMAKKKKQSLVCLRNDNAHLSSQISLKDLEIAALQENVEAAINRDVGIKVQLV